MATIVRGSSPGYYYSSATTTRVQVSQPTAQVRRAVTPSPSVTTVSKPVAVPQSASQKADTTSSLVAPSPNVAIPLPDIDLIHKVTNAEDGVKLLQDFYTSQEPGIALEITEEVLSETVASLSALEPEAADSDQPSLSPFDPKSTSPELK